jgi:hypothetical protein
MYIIKPNLVFDIVWVFYTFKQIFNILFRLLQGLFLKRKVAHVHLQCFISTAIFTKIA